MSKYLKQISGTNKISECSSKGISNEIINKPDDELAPTVGPLGRNMHLKFDGSCLKTTERYDFYPDLTELNIYIVYCLFVAVKLTKNADIGKYKYLGYGIEFDARGTFLFPDGSFAQNVIILGG